RLRAILRRMQPDAGNGGPLTVSGLALWPEKRRVEWQGRPIELTSMEVNLLEGLMRNARRGVSKKNLSEQGVGPPPPRFERSVAVHLSSIRHKLGDAAALIRTVRGQGYHLARE